MNKCGTELKKAPVGAIYLELCQYSFDIQLLQKCNLPADNLSNLVVYFYLTSLFKTYKPSSIPLYFSVKKNLLRVCYIGNNVPDAGKVTCPTGK